MTSKIDRLTVEQANAVIAEITAAMNNQCGDINPNGSGFQALHASLLALGDAGERLWKLLPRQPLWRRALWRVRRMFHAQHRDIK